jgi:hypothetical protein
VINRARPISDFAQESKIESSEQPAAVAAETLYLRLPTESGHLFKKIRAILNMFPGEWPVVLFFADNRTRRGTRAAIDDSRMLEELINLLGEENVVLK